ncbi:NADPH-dependent FMN reductase [Chryseobacterium sp. FH1]|uniref:NADPH-dependent FMN reductase n=1 Tax=Chryseobacterium sp. FH1 TaxID=1233951 RepID=UPI0004E3C1A2|nr:NAD(P)H-dependent oxidoreductase [Chryseobacterium sp. FH1]KFC19523.1 NADPH-dependent FMN reductase [Chryseobacterium sp. FH1]
MKILAFAGSNSNASINKKLVTHTASFFDNHSVEILDLNDYEMPLFSVDKIAKTGMPEVALDFAKKIDESDLLLISLAENNGSYTTAFKNIYDWISVVPDRKAFGNKPIFILASSPGPRGGLTVLETAKNTFPHFGANVIETFSLPNFYANFNEENGIVNEAFITELESKINSVKNHFSELNKE